MYCGDITNCVERIHSNSLLLFDTIPFPLLNFKTNEGDTAYFGNDERTPFEEVGRAER